MCLPGSASAASSATGPACQPVTILVYVQGIGTHGDCSSPQPEKLARWYVDHLGFIINYTYDGNYFVKAANGTMLEIVPSEGAPVPQKMKDPGIRHLAIQVDDFDGAHAQLKQSGVKFLTEPYNNQGNRLVFFTDSDGNILHLIQREKPLP